MSSYTTRISLSVLGTAIPIQSNGSESSCVCLASAFGFLRVVGDTFAPTEARPANLPSSLKTFKDESTFLRHSLSSLRCSAVDTPSTDVREEDNPRRSLMHKASIKLSVVEVGNWEMIHLDNFSYVWPSKATGAFYLSEPQRQRVNTTYSRGCTPGCRDGC